MSNVADSQRCQTRTEAVAPLSRHAALDDASPESRPDKFAHCFYVSRNVIFFRSPGLAESSEADALRSRLPRRRAASGRVRTSRSGSPRPQLGPWSPTDHRKKSAGQRKDACWWWGSFSTSEAENPQQTGTAHQGRDGTRGFAQRDGSAQQNARLHNGRPAGWGRVVPAVETGAERLLRELYQAEASSKNKRAQTAHLQTKSRFQVALPRPSPHKTTLALQAR